MKRIYLGVMMIAIAGAIVMTGTRAFFNDTETSQANIFVAGSMDLTVDHSFASYNGDPCQLGECDPWADSSVSLTQGTKKNGSPVDANRSNPDAALGPAETTGTPYDTAVIGTFVSLGFGGVAVYEFIDPIINGTGADLRIYEVTGGTSYPDETASVEVSPDGVSWYPTVPSSITRDGDVDLGTTTPMYFVRITDTTDAGIHGGSADGFDLDAIEVLHCTGSSSYPGGDFCQLWEETDLTSEIFWNFSDIKPADSGRNVISYHVDDNDAWTCLFIHDVNDEENDNIEPEQEDGDTSIPEGELSNFMKLFAWLDLDGDGDYEPGDGESSLFEDEFDDPVVVPIHDTSSSNGLHAGDTTELIGLSWCVGEQSIDSGTGVIQCDGSATDNTAQTDTLTASVTAYAEQVRTNEEFFCGDVAEALFSEDI